LTLRPKSVLGYAIYNNLFEAHGWTRVHVLAQNTSEGKMSDKIRRRVGKLEKAHKIRIKPKSQAGTEGVVPGSAKAKKNSS
jgi:hypothetical protein